jgi:hypothetical protein
MSLQGLFNDTTLMQIQSEQTVPLIPVLPTSLNSRNTKNLEERKLTYSFRVYVTTKVCMQVYNV